MVEIWKEIKGTNDLYRISNKGRVLSVKKNRILKNVLASSGYYVIGIRCNGKKKQVRVHRLIAEYFIDNPLKLPVVHHLNHDRGDYRIENLKWVTLSENKKYDYADGVQVGKTNMKGKFGVLNPGHKKVLQIDMNGSVLQIIDGISEAARMVNGSASHIAKVCKGKLKHHKDYKWRYV